MNPEPEGSDLCEDGSDSTPGRFLCSVVRAGDGKRDDELLGSCLPPLPPPVYPSTALPEGSVHAQALCSTAWQRAQPAGAIYQPPCIFNAPVVLSRAAVVFADRRAGELCPGP